MELNRDVIVVSAFGRGQWLAAEMRKAGMDVLLLDVSRQLGIWPTEDVEGPFGFFKTESLPESFLERVYCEEPYETLENGFTIWLNSGPLELRGPVTRHRIEKLNLNEEIIPELLGNKDKARAKKWIDSAAGHFSQQWLLHFAAYFASTRWSQQTEILSETEPLSIASSFQVRTTSRAAQDKAQHWLDEHKVEHSYTTEVLDLSFEGRSVVGGLELKGQRAGLIKNHQLVWCLSSEETYYLNDRLGLHLFPNGAVESEWCWVRYRKKMSETYELSAVPSHVAIIGDIEAPWTHGNLILLQRTSLVNQLDAWMMIPTVQRFNKDYITWRGRELCERIRSHLSTTEIEILNYPQEYTYTYSQLGPTRYPVFGKEQSTARSFKNVYFDSPEVWEHHNLGAQFESQRRVGIELLAWWKTETLRREKMKKEQ